MAPLRASIYVSPPTPWYKPDGSHGGPWSPITSTLIYGASEAILVDTPITKAQNKELADWIAATIPGKKLKYIYITHGHGDHWFGTNYLLRRFPGARVVATPGTVQHMRDDARDFETSWGRQFPGGLIDTEFAFAEEVTGELELEGERLVPVEVGHADTHDSTVLWVPSLRLAVCGDVVYGDCHQMLGKANTKALRDEWIAAVEKVEALAPQLVVPGHMKAGEVPGCWHLENTKRYIRDFGEIVEGGARNPRELSGKMLELWPSRFNTGALLVGCITAFRGQEKGKL